MTVARKQRIALTGAGGFVGGWLRRVLEDRSQDDAEIITLFGMGNEARRRADLRDAAGVDAQIAECRPDVVINLAAIAAPSAARADPRLAWEVNVMGTLNLATSLLRHVPEAWLVHVSSSEVYGGSFLTSDAALDEAASLAPRSTYGATKAAADLMLGQMVFDGLRCVRLRPFNHTGPYQPEDYVVPSFAKQIARVEAGLQEPVIRVGNLLAERDFLDVRDVAEAYRLTVGKRDSLEPGAVFNIATGAPVSIRRILDILLSLARVPIEVEIDPARVRPNDVPQASGNPAKAREALDWRARIPLEQTLADVLQFWRSQTAAAGIRPLNDGT